MTRREKVLLVRWSIFVTIVSAIFWTIWSLAVGSVPASDAFLPWPFQDRHLPFHVSRWWDVALAAPCLGAACWFMKRGDAIDKSAHLDDFAGGVLLLSAVGLLIAVNGLASSSRSDQSMVVAAIVLFFGLTGFVFAIAYKERWMLMRVTYLQTAGAFLVLGASTGPFHAFLWVFMAMTVTSAAASVGRLLRLTRHPLAAVGRWLSAEGVSDRPPVAETKPAPAAPPDPLAEIDGLVRELASLDGEDARLGQRRAELIASLKTLRSQPETSKRLALRAERPAS